MRPPGPKHLPYAMTCRRRRVSYPALVLLVGLMYFARGLKISHRLFRRQTLIPCRQSYALSATARARTRAQDNPATRNDEPDILLPKSSSRSSPPPPPFKRHRSFDGSRGPSIEVVRGVAGSRKTQYLINKAIMAIKERQAERLLFLVKVGSNADEIRARLERQHNLVFKRYGKTKHFYSEWAQGSAKIWVVTVDAFVDNQLRKHPPLQEQLKKHGGNWEWKCHTLHDLVVRGEHRHCHLKDGSRADMVMVDEAQDVLTREGQLLLELVRAGELDITVVGDEDQLVFDKAVGQDGTTFMDLARQLQGQAGVHVTLTELEVNHRCPAPHIRLANEMGILSRPVQPPSTGLTGAAEEEEPQHKPYLFCAPMGDNPNDMAYRAAKAIGRKIVTLFRIDPGLRLEDVAIISRYVNRNRLFMQLKEELERALAEEGLSPAGGGEAVHLMMTKVNVRKSIDWDRAKGKMPMLSLAACKGRDWKAVFFVDVNEGVLPSPTEVPDLLSSYSNGTTAAHDVKKWEQVGKSLMNVGVSRSTKYLFLFFAKERPSRYLPRPEERLKGVAQLEWCEDTVEEGYRGFRPEEERPHAPEWVSMDGERQQPLKRPFLSKHRISEVADYAPTVHAVVEGDGLVLCKAEQFAKPCSLPGWWKTDEMAKRIVGVMGELMLLRCVVARGLLVDEGGWSRGVSVFDLLLAEDEASAEGEEEEEEGRKGRRKKGRRRRKGKKAEGGAGGGWEEQVFLTGDTLLLNLVADTQLNTHWAALALSGGDGAAAAARYDEALDEIARAWPELEGPVQEELRRKPRCVLHKRFRGLLPKLRLMLQDPHDTPPSVWWNAAILYCDCFDSSHRDPGLVKRLVDDEADVPDELGQLCRQLLRNADSYLQFLQAKDDEGEEEKEGEGGDGEAGSWRARSRGGRRQFSHGSPVELVHVETSHEKLQARNFCPKLDVEAFEHGWRFGVLGKLDFYDSARFRVVEVKCSESPEVLEAYEVQSLVYALVRGVRAYEVVNLLRGRRHKRFVRGGVELWPVLRRVLEKLQMDEDMIGSLALQSVCYVREETRRREKEEQEKQEQDRQQQQEIERSVDGM